MFLSFIDLKWQFFKTSTLPLCLENLDRYFQFPQDIISCLRVRDEEPRGNGRHEILGSDVEIVH